MNKKTDKFYVIDETYSNFAEISPIDYVSITTKCIKCGAIFSKRKSDLKIKAIGKIAGDYYNLVNEKIISNKFKAIVRENNFTGYSINQLNFMGFFDKKGNKVIESEHSFYELSIKGKCGCLRDVNGREIEKCDKCGIVPVDTLMNIVGLSVIEEEWDGSDMFYFKNWENGLIIITERIKNEIEKYELKNITFTNIRDFEFAIF